MKPFFDHASREPREKNQNHEKKRATRRNPDRSEGEPGSRTEIVPARKEDGSRADGPKNDQLVKKIKNPRTRLSTMWSINLNSLSEKNSIRDATQNRSLKSVP